MECFSHPSSQAVGVCKSCGKAVCRACAKDLGFAVACSDSCATESTAVHEMNQRAKRLYGIGVSKPKISGWVIMWVVFGFLFGGFGVFDSISNGQPEWCLLVPGAASFVVAFIAYRRAEEVGFQCCDSLPSTLGTMELKGTLTDQDLRSAAWSHVAPRKVFAFLGLLVLVFMLWALWLAFFGSKQTPGWGKWAVLAFLVYLLAHCFLYVPYCLRRYFCQYKALQREQFLSPTDIGLTITTENGKGTIPWSDLLCWKENKVLFMLYVADNVYYMVPKRFFASEVDIQGFRSVLQSKVTRK